MDDISYSTPISELKDLSETPPIVYEPQDMKKKAEILNEQLSELYKKDLQTMELSDSLQQQKVIKSTNSFLNKQNKALAFLLAITFIINSEQFQKILQTKVSNKYSLLIRSVLVVLAFYFLNKFFNKN